MMEYGYQYWEIQGKFFSKQFLRVLLWYVGIVTAVYSYEVLQPLRLETQSKSDQDDVRESRVCCAFV